MKLSCLDRVFVSPAQLKKLVGKPGVKVIDLRSAADYAKAHIAGAISIPWHSLMVPEREGLRIKWADEAVIERAFALAGLSYDDDLVLYHDRTLETGISFVIFTYAGFDKLYALDGGIRGWDAEVDSSPVTPNASTFTLLKKNGDFIADKEYVAGKIGDPTARIVEGRHKQAYDDGHIPTAAHVYYDSHMKDDKFLKPRDVILRDLAQKGITPEKEIILYCGSGGGASRNFMVLKDVGFKRIMVYLKAWDEWSIDTSKVQEPGVPNFTFAGSTTNSKDSLGPRFFSQSELKSALDQKSVMVLDVRSGPDFGIGRIPGSVNVYWNDTLNENRNPKPAEVLTALFSEKGVTPDKHIVIFTRGGVQLTYMYTLLKLLGYPRVSAYTGRWDGWHVPLWENQSP